MITFREAPVAKSDEVGPGVIADFAFDGQIFGIEILHATRRIDNPAEIHFSLECFAPDGNGKTSKSC
jgi:uncharacterized protein YuzE